MSSKMAKSLSLERDYSSGSESGSESGSDSSDVGSFVKPGVKSEVKSLSADFHRQCSSQEICPNINMVGTSSYAGTLKRGRKGKEHVSAPVSEASESLGDNRSTSKRFCGEYGKHGSPKLNPIKETNHAIVKASFKDYMIKIWFPTSSGLLELKNEVAKRLNLEGEFNLIYRDEEDDLLLIACDDDLHNLPAFLASNTNTSVKLIVKSLTTSESLTMLAVEQHVHNLLSQAAQSLGVSKHFCRDNGKQSSPKPNPNPSKKYNHANDTKRLQEVTVKATFKDDIIKFQFPTSSGLLELKNEVAQRLELKGKLNIKYKDEDDDLILITCDADLHKLPEFLASDTNTSVKLLVMLVSE